MSKRSAKRTYKIDDTVTYRNNAGERVTGVVVNYGKKNGKRVFDIEDEDGDGWWGYDSSIISVKKAS